MRDISIGYTLWPRDFELIDPGPWLDEAERHRVDTVEVPFFTTRVIVDRRVHEAAARRFLAPFAGRPFGVTAHAMLTINLMDAPEMIPTHEAVLEANLDFAARLGAERMVLHCGMTAETDPREIEDAYARQRESLARMGDGARARGVTLCIETVWSFDGRGTALPSRLAAELRAVGHPNVLGTLDYAHSLLQCELTGADFHAEIAEIAPLCPHLHLNDCFGGGPATAMATPAEAVAYGAGDLHLPLGWGGIPWERVLTEPAYPDMPLTLNQELHQTYWPALADDVAEMDRLRALMQGRNAG